MNTSQTNTSNVMNDMIAVRRAFAHLIMPQTEVHTNLDIIVPGFEVGYDSLDGIRCERENEVERFTTVIIKAMTRESRGNIEAINWCFEPNSLTMDQWTRLRDLVVDFAKEIKRQKKGAWYAIYLYATVIQRTIFWIEKKSPNRRWNVSRYAPLPTEIKALVSSTAVTTAPVVVLEVPRVTTSTTTTVTTPVTTSTTTTTTTKEKRKADEQTDDERKRIHLEGLQRRLDMTTNQVRLAEDDYNWCQRMLELKRLLWEELLGQQREIREQLEQAKAEQQEDCILCYDKPARCKLNSCIHRFCEACCLKLLSINNDKCPLCRTKFDSYDSQ